MWSCNTTVGHIPGEKHGPKGHMHHNIHCSTVYNSQDMEATSMSIDRGMDKDDVVHIDSGILLSH